MSHQIPLLLTIADACSRYGFSRSRAYRFLAEGELAAVKLGSRTLIDTAKADAFVAALPTATFRAAGTGITDVPATTSLKG